MKNKFEITQQKLDDLELIQKMLKISFRADNYEEALQKNCKDYGINYEAVLMVIDTDLRCPLDSERDTLTVVGADFGSKLIPSKLKDKDRAFYIEALQAVIRQFDKEVLQFATLRYIELKDLKDIEQIMGVKEKDIRKYMKRVGSKLKDGPAVITSVYRDIKEIAEDSKRIDELKETKYSGVDTDSYIKMLEGNIKSRLDSIEDRLYSCERYYGGRMDKKDKYKNVNINEDDTFVNISANLRLAYTMKANGISTIGDLKKYKLAQLRKLKYMSERSYTELCDIIKKAGLELKR